MKKKMKILKMLPMPYVPQELIKAAELYLQRNKQYGDSYKTFGPMMKALMKEVTLKTSTDFGRFALLNFIVSKLHRYVNNWSKGGHDDSLSDISVYCQMLKELDNEEKFLFDKLRKQIKKEGGIIL